MFGYTSAWPHQSARALSPPELPWNPGTPAPYHHGAYLLNGLLAPPFGLDLHFSEKFLSVYVWTGLFLIVATALWRRGSGFATLIAAPLLLTAGALVRVVGEPASIVEVPIPAEVPAAGLRSSLMDIFWPSIEVLGSASHSALPNIWKPALTLSYALSFVVLWRAAHAGRRSWLSVTTLAFLVGFMGITSPTLTPIVLILWAGLEAMHLFQSRRAGSPLGGALVRSIYGLTLASVLLVGGLWPILLGDSGTSGLSIGANEHFGGWRLLGRFDRLPGGVALLGLGPLAVGGIAVLLARRDRLVLALAAGTSMLLLASLVLHYEPYPWDLVRLEGHAGNLALWALLVAIGIRLNQLRSMRWRYIAGAALVGLVVWPTIAAPVHSLRLALDNGVELAKAGPNRIAPDIAAYIRNHTAIDARVFSPHFREMNYATGRPNASGFAGLVHLNPSQGPQFRDVIGYLEPAAVRRLSFDYIHAPDSWVDGLPNEAADRLNDPKFFEHLVRDRSESLYRVLPAFLSLDTPPAPGSYEALRQAVPPSATVLLPEIFQSRPVNRTAWALSHARLLGVVGRQALHLRTPWQIAPLGDRIPDLIIAPLRFVPWMLPADSRQPIWWNDETAVYCPQGNRRSDHAASND